MLILVFVTYHYFLNWQDIRFKHRTFRDENAGVEQLILSWSHT
jgi:hypothetical protein